MVNITGYADEDRGNRQDLEDLASYQLIKTASGLQLHLGIVCDVDASDGATGERAVRRLVKDITDSITRNSEVNIPKLLSDAVKEANINLYDEFKGAAIASVSLAAIDDQNTSDDPNGRMYVASVGDGRVYLIRDHHLVRLNIDHVVAEELVRAGQMDADLAKNHPNANYPTRALGAKREIEVDIGFYKESGQEVSSRRAFEIGKLGMQLRDGDTILLATDGVFHRSDDNDPQWVISEERFRHYALHDNVEQAVKRLKDYGISQRPHDNIALTLMFAPSSRRRNADRIRWYQDRRFVGLGLILMLFVCAAASFGYRSFQQAQEVSLAATEQEAARVAFVLQLSATATPTSTPSNTPTRTARPTQVSGQQIGIQLFPPSAPSTGVPVLIESSSSSDNPPIYLDQPILSSRPSDLLIEGFDLPSVQNPLGFEPANVFMKEGSLTTIRQVNNKPGEESAILSLFPAGDLFANLGNMMNGSLEINILLNDKLGMNGNAECMAAKQIPRNATIPDDPEKVAFTCFKDANGLEGSCSIRFPEESGTPIMVMPIGKRVLVDITNNRLIETTDVVYSEMVEYYERVKLILGGPDKVECLTDNGYLDPDGDKVSYPQDVCPFEVGVLENQGCAKKPIPDMDGDGIEGDSYPGDVCPAEKGPPENYGCLNPITLTPTPTLTPSVTPSYTMTLTPVPTGFTPSLTPIPTDTPTITPSNTPIPFIPTFTPTGEITLTISPTPNVVVSTSTKAATVSSTPITPTLDLTNSATPQPSATPTGCFQIPNGPGCGIPPVIVSLTCTPSTVTAGGNTTCTVAAGGSGPLTYTWSIVGAAGSGDKDLPNCKSTDSSCRIINIGGTFHVNVIVQNPLGSPNRDSDPILVIPVISEVSFEQIENTPPNGTDAVPPYNFAVFADTDFTLSVDASPGTADDIPQYRWYEGAPNGTLVSNQVDVVLNTITQANYWVKVTMSGGDQINPNLSQIVIRTKPRITQPLLSANPKCKDEYTFTTDAIGDGNPADAVPDIPSFVYRWQRHDGTTWQAIPLGNVTAGCGFNDTTCTVKHFSVSPPAFNYRVVVDNANINTPSLPGSNNLNYAALNVSSATLNIVGTCLAGEEPTATLAPPVVGRPEPTATFSSGLGN